MPSRVQNDILADRQSDSLAALAITLFLIVAALYLIDHLETAAAIQDCVLSGRTACGA